MPILDWIGKDKVINHHLDVPYHMLDCKYSFDENGIHKNDYGSENMIIHGDNLLALKSLLPQFENGIDCIYIDPPYNTGEENWVYNDSVNDPRIKKWLGEVVGKEGEDLSRHDKWLCMIYPRLKLLQRLLSDDGLIFISIDDNEVANLKLVCNEIFSPNNFIAMFIWEKRTNRENRKEVSSRHDYILCYCKKKAKQNLNQLSMTDKALSSYSNPDNDPRGPWKSDPATAQAGHATENQFYTLETPNGNRFDPPAGRCWLYTKERFLEEIQAGRIWLGKDGNNTPRKKTYLYEKERGLVPESLWFAKDVATNEIAKNAFKIIFNDTDNPFPTIKPHELIERVIRLSTKKDSVILDSFAGSGTTAHAVLKLNKEDGGNRKFILIEMMDYADSITAERVKRVITGYSKDEEILLYDEDITIGNIANGSELLSIAKEVAKNAKTSGEYSSVKNPKIEEGHLRVVAIKNAKDQEPGIPGNFCYYELGDTLMKDGLLNENVEIDKIREYVYYMETKQKVLKKNEVEPYLLGQHVGNAYYFYYQKNSMTTLDREFLHTVKTKAEGYVIYADLCTLSDHELERYHITFKKIPRDISKL